MSQKMCSTRGRPSPLRRFPLTFALFVCGLAGAHGALAADCGGMPGERWRADRLAGPVKTLSLARSVGSDAARLWPVYVVDYAPTGLMTRLLLQFGFPDTPVVVTFTYDDHGVLTAERSAPLKVTKSPPTLTDMRWTNDARGRPTRRELTQGVQLVTVFEYDYDDSAHTLTETGTGSRSGRQDVFVRRVYTYDAEGRLSEFTETWPGDDGASRHVTCTRDADGRLLLETSQRMNHGKPDPVNELRVSYTDDGRQITLSAPEYGGGTRLLVMDPDNRYVQRETFHDAQGRVQSTTTYDDAGRMIEHACLSDVCGPAKGTVTVERTFDAQGNWIEEIERRQTATGAVILGTRTRSLSYYDADTAMATVPQVAPWSVPGLETSRAVRLPLAPRP